MIVNYSTIRAFLLCLTLALPAAVQAQAANVSPTLKKMLGSLPIANMKDELQRMMVALEKTPCGGGLKGCYATSTGPLQLYLFTSGTAQQTLLLVVDQQMVMPNLLSEKAQKFMGGTALRSPIIAISTTDFTLDQVKMPAALQKVVRERYFNVNSLEFVAGVQLAARADLGGPIKLAMEAFGVKGNEVTIRAAVVMPIPTDLAGAAGAGAGMAGAVNDGATMKKAGADALNPEAFVELQFAPNAVLAMPMPHMTLTDATFFINNAGTFGFKGNASYEGVPNKTFLMQFQTPLNPAGALDLLDFSFRMATPANFTMEDAAHVMVALASPDPRLAPYGGGFIRNIASFKQPLLAATKPLSVFKLQNPLPVPVYRFGDSSKPWPTNDKVFNIVVLGPLADGGPYMSAAGEVNILGQKMGWLDASAGASGLHGAVGEALTLKLGPLGKVKFRMEALVDVDKGRQDISLKGNLAGQKVEVTLSGSTMSVYVNATCVNPFEIKTQLTIEASTDIAKVFDGQGGVNVDPAKLPNCIGKELEAAYKKIAGEYKDLSGYTASAANAELKKISDAAAAELRKAEEEAKKAAEASRKAYDDAKNAARDVASKTSNAANQAFNEAGNAFKRIGKKKKHKKGPDPKFAASVFDWDYYYDNAPDVVQAKVDLATHWRDNGFNEGRQGSPEFNVVFYRNRYLDVQGLCGAADKLCALNHWLDYGIRQGRQGSANFSVASYLNRYPDLQNAFGRANYEDALDHWFNNGEDEGRDPRPDATASAPLNGMAQAGGGGGSPWDDSAVCQGQHVIGFRIRTGARVDGVQFLYPNGWGAAHGNLGKPPYTYELVLPAGQYFHAVHYRSGGSMDALGLIANTGAGYGMFGGGGGTFNAYAVNAGQKLGCVSGRAGSEIDQLTFSSTGPR